MWEDSIVKETRALREEYVAAFDHDMDAIFDDILLRQSKSNRIKRSFPGRKPSNVNLMQASEDSEKYTVD
jgi:hypothetical protein